MKKIININWFIHSKDTGSAIKNADKISIKLFFSSVRHIDKVCDHVVQKVRLDPFYFSLDFDLLLSFLQGLL